MLPALFLFSVSATEARASITEGGCYFLKASTRSAIHEPLVNSWP